MGRIIGLTFADKKKTPGRPAGKPVGRPPKEEGAKPRPVDAVGKEGGATPRLTAIRERSEHATVYPQPSESLGAVGKEGESHAGPIETQAVADGK